MTIPFALYTDGGLIGTNGDVELGTYTWLQVDADGGYLAHESGLVKPFPDKPVENNMVELCALLRGLRSLPDGWSGTVYSDNVNALGWTRSRLKKSGQRYTQGGVPASLKPYIEKQMARLGSVAGVHLDGHPTDEELEKGTGHSGEPVHAGNRFCDDHCKAERLKYQLVNGQGVYKLTRREYARLTDDTKEVLLALGYAPPGCKKGARPMMTEEEADAAFEEAINA